jgi:hypothetical protein
MASPNSTANEQSSSDGMISFTGEMMQAYNAARGPMVDRESVQMGPMLSLNQYAPNSQQQDRKGKRPAHFCAHYDAPEHTGPSSQQDRKGKKREYEHDEFAESVGSSNRKGKKPMYDRDAFARFTGSAGSSNQQQDHKEKESVYVHDDFAENAGPSNQQQDRKGKKPMYDRDAFAGFTVNAGSSNEQHDSKGKKPVYAHVDMDENTGSNTQPIHARAGVAENEDRVAAVTGYASYLSLCFSLCFPCRCRIHLPLFPFSLPCVRCRTPAHDISNISQSSHHLMQPE